MNGAISLFNWLQWLIHRKYLEIIGNQNRKYKFKVTCVRVFACHVNFGYSSECEQVYVSDQSLKKILHRKKILAGELI